MINVRVGDIVKYQNDWESQIYWGHEVSGLSCVKFQVSEWRFGRFLVHTRGIIIDDPLLVFGPTSVGREVPIYWLGSNMDVVQRASEVQIRRRLTVIPKSDEEENQERKS